MQRDALFELLASSPEAVCVVTSNRRLARSLSAEFDRYQTERSRTVWETPQILPYTAFVETLYDLAQHDPDLPSMPTPLTATQERALWEAVLRDSDLGMLSSAAGAGLAANAWALAHQWNVAARVRRYTAVADTRVFINWAGEYHRRVEAARATDHARLPDIVREYVDAGTIAAPPRVVLAGFDETTPQQQQLFDALVSRGTLCERFEPMQHAAKPRRAACLDEHDENERMADWVAARLAADPRARIGIVVPQLGFAPALADGGARCGARCRIDYWRRQVRGRTRFRSAAPCLTLPSLHSSCVRFDWRLAASRSKTPVRCCARLTSQAQPMSVTRATWWMRSCDSVASARSTSNGYSKPCKPRRATAASTLRSCLLVCAR